ncbi:hypothetical protein PR371_20620 [Mycobacterium marinum]|nr:hypothetical protein [Mycobacterium marinum]MDC8996373.1 hypothetical protein [Mycobacterium marinum]WDZ16619.1 hypothetical protein PQR73_014905 [Mycobacterium marinum]
MPNPPPQPAPRPRTWPLIALAITAITGVFLGATALIRPDNNGSAATSPTTGTPSYTAAETAAAHQKLCDTYKLAARAVQIDTNGTNPALAAAALANGAVMLVLAANTAPALVPDNRAAALSLAHAYSDTNAMGSFLSTDDPALRAAVDDVNSKDAQMKTICGNG